MENLQNSMISTIATFEILVNRAIKQGLTPDQFIEGFMNNKEAFSKLNANVLKELK